MGALLLEFTHSFRLWKSVPFSSWTASATLCTEPRSTNAKLEEAHGAALSASLGRAAGGSQAQTRALSSPPRQRGALQTHQQVTEAQAWDQKTCVCPLTTTQHHLATYGFGFLSYSPQRFKALTALKISKGK